MYAQPIFTTEQTTNVQGMSGAQFINSIRNEGVSQKVVLSISKSFPENLQMDANSLFMKLGARLDGLGTEQIALNSDNFSQIVAESLKRTKTTNLMSNEMW